MQIGSVSSQFKVIVQPTDSPKFIAGHETTSEAISSIELIQSVLDDEPHLSGRRLLN